MFIVERRLCTNFIWGRWFRVWDNPDGAECAAYLKTLAENDARQGLLDVKETRMRYEPE
jgi:hypothetical protein